MMVEIQELVRDAVETVRPRQVDDVVRTVHQGLRRGRLIRANVALLSVLALVAGVAGVSQWWNGVMNERPNGPLIITDGALSAGPLSHRAIWAVDSYRDGHYTPIVALSDGSRYTLPGELSSGVNLFGTALSPSGRWIAYNRDDGVEVRDLSSSTTYHTAKAHNGGYPTAWSANERFVLLAVERYQGSLDTKASGASTTSSTMVRLDLRTGKTVSVDPSSVVGRSVKSGGLTPDGDLLVSYGGATPTPKPHKRLQLTIGDARYRTLNPVTHKLGPALTMPKAQLWTSEDKVRIDPEHPKHTPRYGWVEEAEAPIITSADGRYAATVMSTNANHTPTTVTVTDLSKGSSKTVDITALLGHRAHSHVFDWRPVAFHGSSITMLGSTGRNAFVSQLTVDLAKKQVTTLRGVHYPENSLVAARDLMGR
ncbi:MAG: hypothetical protein WCA46_12785 [Actinocatenispora sp.]